MPSLPMQVHRSVKYMTAAEREARREEVEGRREVRIVNGEIRGEWELEHTYLCAACAEPYDELREVGIKIRCSVNVIDVIIVKYG